METIYQAVNYLGMRARTLGRAIFGNEAGAITLEWLVIAVALVAAATAAGWAFRGKINAELNRLP
jgi:hypothetical protein